MKYSFRVKYGVKVMFVQVAQLYCKGHNTSNNNFRLNEEDVLPVIKCPAVDNEIMKVSCVTGVHVEKFVSSMCAEVPGCLVPRQEAKLDHWFV